MSGIAMVLIAAGGGAQGGTASLIDTKTAPTTASASIRLNTDGTITYTGSASRGSSGWYSPSTPGIGSSYWARLALGTAPTPSSGSGTGIVSVSGAPIWTWRAISATVSGTATVNLFADAGGVTQVGSISLTVDVEST